MLLNNIEMDLKIKMLEKETTQASIAKHIGVSDAYVNRIVRKREQILNRTFLHMLEDMGYDVRLYNCPGWCGNISFVCGYFGKTATSRADRTVADGAC